jgi:hypothetical protein
LPALTGKDYTLMEIQEGGEASREFVRVTFGDVSEVERKRVRLAQLSGLSGSMFVKAPATPAAMFHLSALA